MLRSLLLLSFATVALAGCAGARAVSLEETEAKYRPQLPQNASGLRAAVMVADFTTDYGASHSAEYTVVDYAGREHTISWGYNTQIKTGQALAEQLQSALASTEHFVVNVREETFGALQQEEVHAESGWVTENEVQRGGLVSPDLFVKATITEWSPNVEGGGSGLGGLLSGVPLLGGLKWENSMSRVGLQLQIVDRRQQIVATIPVDVEAKSTDWTVGGIGRVSGSLVGGVLDQYSNTTMEEAIAVAIRTSVERIYERIPRDYFRYSSSAPAMAHRGS